MTGLKFVLVPYLNRGEKGSSLPRSHCGETVGFDLVSQMATRWHCGPRPLVGLPSDTAILQSLLSCR